MLPLVVHQLRRLLERALAQREGACRKGDAGQLSARRERVELREASGQLPQRVCQKSSEGVEELLMRVAEVAGRKLTWWQYDQTSNIPNIAVQSSLPSSHAARRALLGA